MSYLRLERDADGIVELIFDQQGKSVNVMGDEYAEAMPKALDDLEAMRDDITGVYVRSGKPGQFFAGGDITGDTLELKGKRPGLPDVPVERFHRRERRDGQRAERGDGVVESIATPDHGQALRLFLRFNDFTSSGSGCCASCGCSGPAKIFSLSSILRPSLFLGSMRRTASSMSWMTPM